MTNSPEPQAAPTKLMCRHYIVIPLAALVALLPVFVFGTSCGHDMQFHLLSWVEAAAQLRHGTLYPHWASSPAWQSGEPRFIFYPPLSWMFGALLTMLLPMAAAPNTFLFAVMLAAGFSMHAVVRRFTSPNGALVAACVYLANPYMLFNAFERSAYAEMLASVWIPLLFLIVLRRRPPVVPLALGLALAWLTNVPAGIMATYTFMLLAGTRLLFDWHLERKRSRLQAELTSQSERPVRREVRAFVFGPEDETLRLPPALRSTLFTLIASLLIGLCLPGIYLLPAAFERRFVQSSMVMIDNLRYQDNYLFQRTAWEPHNVVIRAISLIAVAMLAATACVLLWLFLWPRNRPLDPRLQRTRLSLAILFGLVLFLLLPISGFIWGITPELAFLQFPWRLLTVLAVVLAVGLALVLRKWHAQPWHGPAVALLCAACVTGVASHLYRQACEVPRMAQHTADLFRENYGIVPTDEYTPGDADNDVLRTDNPGYWLVPGKKPNSPAPGTLPDPNENPKFEGDVPESMTRAAHAPRHLDLTLAQPAILVLNLRDFHDWRITRNRASVPAHVHRDDGLIALPLPAGPSHIDIVWHSSADFYAGTALSLLAAISLGLVHRRSRNAARVESDLTVS